MNDVMASMARQDMVKMTLLKFQKRVPEVLKKMETFSSKKHRFKSATAAMKGVYEIQMLWIKLDMALLEDYLDYLNSFDKEGVK